MRVTLELSPAIAARLEEMAAERGEDLATFLRAVVEREAVSEETRDSLSPHVEGDASTLDHMAAGAEGMTTFERRLATNPAFAELHERVRLTPERIAERQARTLTMFHPRNPPSDGTNGMHLVFGQWPGDETEEELLAMERILDDEDAGRRGAGS